MLELYQFPWSPYCLAIGRVLQYGGVAHRQVDVSSVDRSRVWKLTRQRYYQVPVIKHRRNVIFETGPGSQVIAKYIDAEFELNLFPARWMGLQTILWLYIEDDVENLTFRLNDAYYEEFVPPADRLAYLRHKERKFGFGCIAQWRRGSKLLLGELAGLLQPFEQMLRTRPFLLEDRPRFVDLDLWGMLANLQYSGHYKLPNSCARLKRWYNRLSTLRASDFPSEKLHP